MAALGPSSQHLEDLGCHSSEDSWRVHSYFGDLGEDSPLYPVGNPSL